MSYPPPFPSTTYGAPAAPPKRVHWFWVFGAGFYDQLFVLASFLLGAGVGWALNTSGAVSSGASVGIGVGAAILFPVIAMFVVIPLMLRNRRLTPGMFVLGYGSTGLRPPSGSRKASPGPGASGWCC